MVTYGGNRPTVNDNEVLTAEKFNDATRFWVTDELPDDGKDGDVVFVIGDSPVGDSGELPGLGGWATIEEVSGTYTKHTYGDWVAYEWTGDGEVTTTPGLVDSLLVGAATHQFNGGNVREGLTDVSANGTITIGVYSGDNQNLTAGTTRIGPADISNKTFASGGLYSRSFVGNNPQDSAPEFTDPMMAGYKTNITGTPVVHGHTANALETVGIVTGYGCGRIGNKNGLAVVRVPSTNAQNVIENFFRWISYATVENGVVTKVTKTPDNKPYTASAQEVECDASVQEGYLYENGEFTAPEPDYSDEIAALTARLEELRNG